MVESINTLKGTEHTGEAVNTLHTYSGRDRF